MYNVTGSHLRNERTNVLTEFINMDVSVGYDQISRQVWARVCKFLS